MENPANFQAVVEGHLADHPDERLYFLFDHAGLPGLLRKLELCDMPWISLFEHTRESTALAVAPILVTAGDKDGILPSWFFKWIAQHGAYSSAVTLISTRMALRELSYRLVARLDIKLSENMDAMLRFFDPRVLAQLRMTLSLEQSEAFFGVGTQWWYIDRAGIPIYFEANFIFSDDDFFPLSLSRDQEFEMLDATEIDQVLLTLNTQIPKLVQTVPIAYRANFVLKSICKARKMGLESVQDFTIYVVAILVHGPEWLQSKFPSRASENVVKNSALFRNVVIATD